MRMALGYEGAGATVNDRWEGRTPLDCLAGGVDAEFEEVERLVREHGGLRSDELGG